MTKATNLIFGISFSLFNIGFVLSQFYDLGFDILLFFGITSSIGLLLMLGQSLIKDIEGSLIYLTVASFILCLISYLHSFPYTKVLKITGMVFFLGLSFKKFLTDGFNYKYNDLIKHHFLNHPILKISFALALVSIMFKILKWDYHIQIYMLISLTLIAWSFFKFIKPEIKTFPNT